MRTGAYRDARRINPCRESDQFTNPFHLAFFSHFQIPQNLFFNILEWANTAFPSGWGVSLSEFDLETSTTSSKAMEESSTFLSRRNTVKTGSLEKIYKIIPFSAFVEFEDERDAADAVKDLDDQKLNGSRVRLEVSKGCKDKYRDFQRTGRVRYRSYSKSVSPGRRRHRSRSPVGKGRSRSRSPARVWTRNMSSEKLKLFFRALTGERLSTPSRPTRSTAHPKRPAGLSKSITWARDAGKSSQTKQKRDVIVEKTRWPTLGTNVQCIQWEGTTDLSFWCTRKQTPVRQTRIFFGRPNPISVIKSRGINSHQNPETR